MSSPIVPNITLPTAAARHSPEGITQLKTGKAQDA